MAQGMLRCLRAARKNPLAAVGIVAKVALIIGALLGVMRVKNDYYVNVGSLGHWAQQPSPSAAAQEYVSIRQDSEDRVHSVLYRTQDGAVIGLLRCHVHSNAPISVSITGLTLDGEPSLSGTLRFEDETGGIHLAADGVLPASATGDISRFPCKLMPDSTLEIRGVFDLTDNVAKAGADSVSRFSNFIVVLPLMLYSNGECLGNQAVKLCWHQPSSRKPIR
jgi:hypothetical protein